MGHNDMCIGFACMPGRRLNAKSRPRDEDNDVLHLTHWGILRTDLTS